MLLVFIKVGLPSIRERWEIMSCCQSAREVLETNQKLYQLFQSPIHVHFSQAAFYFHLCLPIKYTRLRLFPIKCIFFGIYLLFLSLLEHIIFFVKVFVLFVKILKDVVLQDLQRNGRIFLLRAAVLQPHRALASDSNLVFESGNSDFPLFYVTV